MASLTENVIASSIEKIITIDNFWGTKSIPAILRDVECNFPGYSEVWIPEGYDNGGGGYSMRKTHTIQEFKDTDEVKNDVMLQWKNKNASIN